MTDHSKNMNLIIARENRLHHAILKVEHELELKHVAEEIARVRKQADEKIALLGKREEFHKRMIESHEMAIGVLGIGLDIEGN